jgi:hypothetical protein
MFLSMYTYTCFQKRIFLRSQALSQYDFLIIQGISRVIMSPTTLKMQPTIHSQNLKKSRILKLKYPAFFHNVLWVAFSMPSGSLSLVKYPPKNLFACSFFFVSVKNSNVYFVSFASFKFWCNFFYFC